MSDLLTQLTSQGVRLRRDGSRLFATTPTGAALEPELRSMIKSRKEELLSLLEAKEGAGSTRRGLKAPSGAAVRCSAAQQGFLFSSLIEASAETYRLNAGFRISGRLDSEALTDSLADVVQRHDALRMRFAVRDGVAFIEDSDWRPKLTVQVFDGNEDELLRRLAKEQPAFDLIEGPHLFASLHCLSEFHHVLFISIHHIACDGGSISLLAREISASYAWRAGLSPEVPTGPEMTFRDIAHREHLASEEGHDATGLEFWHDELAGAPALIALPTDYPRPRVRERHGSSIPLCLGAEMTARMAEAKTATGLTDFQIVTAALALVLHRQAQQPSVVIGTPWRNREQEGGQTVIGPLLNLLPLHVKVGACATTGDLLAEVRERTLRAIHWGSVPFEAIVERVKPPRSAAFTPLFQVMCAIEPSPVDIGHIQGTRIESLDVPDLNARYDLALVLRRSREGLRGALKFDRALFSEASAQRFADHFLAAFDAVLGRHERPLSEVALLSGAEVDVLSNLSSGPIRTDYPLEKTLIDLFEETVGCNPDKIALEDDARSLTYRELDREAAALAAELRGAAVGLDDVVAIAAPRSIAFVIAVVAAMKAGAGYVPIDPSLPEERRKFMIDQSGASLLISGDGGPKSLAWTRLVPPRSSVLTAYRPQPYSAAYVIYTSGSTGHPKGVLTDSRAIVNNLLWMNDAWPLTSDDALLFKSMPGFDVSVKEIFWPLLAGARLVVAPPGAERDPEALQDLIRRQRITVVHLVPTMLEFFLAQGAHDGMDFLRIVMCGGEALTPDLRRRFHARYRAQLLHMYGPTEAAIAVTGTAIGPDDASDDVRLPLGRPMPNCRIHILDAELHPLPVGVPGELCIAGVPLARCYLGSGGLTAEKFVPEPGGPEPGARMYRSGDLARWRPDGQIDFLGRIDRQIKLRGLRIEPGEIEAALREQDGVEDALVIVHVHGATSMLLGYVVTGDEKLDRDHLGARLRARLPDYMVPANIVPLSAFPMNANGKIDLDALPKPKMPATDAPFDAPRTEMEMRVAEIWQELLELDRIARDEYFFELGGNSLLMVRLQSRLTADVGINVPLAELFLNTQLKELADYLEQVGRNASESGSIIARVAKAVLRN